MVASTDENKVAKRAVVKADKMEKKKAAQTVASSVVSTDI